VHIAGSSHRALEVLELFSVEQRPLTVSAVAAALEYPQSSTSVLLQQLAQLGYLHHDRSARTYQPTIRVMFLGVWLHHRLLHEGNLARLAEALAKASGRLVRLAMQNGLYVQYIRTELGRALDVDLRPGQQRSLCRSAVGKALLTAKTKDEVERLVRHINAIDGPHVVRLSELWEELEACRARGYVESVDGIVRGISAIGMLLPITELETPLAISICLPSRRLDALREPTVQLMRDTIHRFLPSAPLAEAAV
jgi:DNA-binding IclR family transcriptional regulator